MKQSDIDLLRTQPIRPQSLLIGGKWRDASDGGRRDVISPIDGALLTTLAEGTILSTGAAPTVGVTNGPHVVADQHCTVGHDCVLDAFVTLYPGAHISGSVHLKRGVTIGAGAVVLPETTVGPNATVGAGAVVTEDLPADCTAVGVPARPLS